jgi:putative ABC transport system permease protein
VDPTVAIERVKTLDDIRTDSLASRIFARQLLVGFSVIGTLLTVIAVYGVLTLSIASRRREIAIRSALGAAAVTSAISFWEKDFTSSSAAS